jgi:hypothetical protein
MDARARPRSASRAGRSRRGDRPDSTPPARVAAAPQQRTPKQGARHRNSARIKGHGHLCRFVGMQKGAKPVFRRSPLLSCDILVGGLAGFRSVKLRQSRTGLLHADRTGSQPLARRGRRTRSRHLLVANTGSLGSRAASPAFVLARAFAAQAFAWLLMSERGSPATAALAAHRGCFAPIRAIFWRRPTWPLSAHCRSTGRSYPTPGSRPRQHVQARHFRRQPNRRPRTSAAPPDDSRGSTLDRCSQGSLLLANGSNRPSSRRARERPPAHASSMVVEPRAANCRRCRT